MAKGTEGAFEGRQLPKKWETFKEDTETSVYHIRLHEERAKLLKQMFQAQGQDTGSGIRAVLYDWMAKNMR